VQGLQGLFLQIDITEIVVHKSHQPDAIVDLLNADSLTRQRSAEIYFLSENANSPTVGNQSGAIVERIVEFPEAAIGPRGRGLDVGGTLHSESFMGALVVKFLNEGIELSWLLEEVGTGRAGSLHF
jgi:hypothetical protein